MPTSIDSSSHAPKLLLRPAGDADAASARRLCILLIEHCVDDVIAIMAALRQCAYPLDTHWLRDIPSTAHLAFHTDLVMLGTQVFSQSTLDLVKTIQCHDALGNKPILLLARDIAPSGIETARQSGIAGFLLKHQSHTQFQNSVRKAADYWSGVLNPTHLLNT